MIKELYFDFFRQILSQKTDYEIGNGKLTKKIKEFALEGSIDGIVTLVEKILNKISRRDFIKFDEKYIKLIFVTLLMRRNIYLVKSEYEVTTGFVDIVLFERNNIDVNYEGIIELKYIKQQDYDKKGSKIIKEKVQTGQEQIQKYLAAEELQHKDNLLSFVIVFAGSQCVKIEQV